jgi:hypothetical protein
MNKTTTVTLDLPKPTGDVLERVAFDRTARS